MQKRKEKKKIVPEFEVWNNVKIGNKNRKKKQKYDFIYNNVKIGFEKMKRL
jgi:hypothetical protein